MESMLSIPPLAEAGGKSVIAILSYSFSLNNVSCDQINGCKAQSLDVLPHGPLCSALALYNGRSRSRSEAFRESGERERERERRKRREFSDRVYVVHFSWCHVLRELMNRCEW